MWNELLEVRRQIRMIYSKWLRTRFVDDVDVNCRPLITSDEWGKLVVMQFANGNWGEWNERDSKYQWGILDCAGCLSGKPTEGGEISDDGAIDREEFTRGSLAKKNAQMTEMAASKERPKMPFEAMPKGNGPTGKGNGCTGKLPQILDQPAEPKPSPPAAPWKTTSAHKVEEDEKKIRWPKVNLQTGEKMGPDH